MAKTYLAYDVKGIQHFIFSIPRLKYVVGASSLIWEFDNEVARSCAEKEQATLVFSGGGRGSFECNDQESENRLKDALIARAHKFGLDIRVQREEEILNAGQNVDEVYPFVPDTLDGEPCKVSGFWPVPAQDLGPGSEGGAGEHSVVLQRRLAAAKDRLGNNLLEDIRRHSEFPPELLDVELAFIRSAHPDAEDSPEEAEDGRAGASALGNRNRWAIIAMDANDIGGQFRLARKRYASETFKAWIRHASQQLEQCTRSAFLEALAKLIRAWWHQEKYRREEFTKNRTGTVVLPFRPLILGGDDVLCLCHSSYAMRFAKDLSDAFTRKTGEASQALQKEGVELWPATGGRLTISAGIAYTGVSYPLHTSIPYAENLLASAKGQFRKDVDAQQEPVPAAVDWESLTENLIDTPSERRNRCMRFQDQELHTEICLTERPYAFDDLEGIFALAEQLQKIPRSILSEVLPNLYRPWSGRVRWLAALAKHSANHILVEQLHEWNTETPGSGWNTTPRGRSTKVPDAVLLLEEEHRMAQGSLAEG
jgi:hypothetical protein